MSTADYELVWPGDPDYDESLGYSPQERSTDELVCLRSELWNQIVAALMLDRLVRWLNRRIAR